VNHRRSVDNCNDVKTEDSTTPRDQSNGNLKVGLTASGIEVARPFCRRGYMELGNLSSRCQGRNSSGEPVRVRVPMRGTGAESCVVALKGL
jgi:hypothetical protein